MSTSRRLSVNCSTAACFPPTCLPLTLPADRTQARTRTHSPHTHTNTHTHTHSRQSALLYTGIDFFFSLRRIARWRGGISLLEESQKTERTSRDGASRSHIAVSLSLFTQGKKKKRKRQAGRVLKISCCSLFVSLFLWLPVFMCIFPRSHPLMSPQPRRARAWQRAWFFFLPTPANLIIVRVLVLRNSPLW
jgi:hypothetical protein